MYFIREITKEDVALINAWRNDPELASCLGAPFAYVSQERDLAWYESYLKTRSTNVRCAIVRKADQKMIGVVYLLNINAVNRSAERGIMIGSREDRGNGAGRYAVEEILRHAFLDLNLHRVSLNVLQENTRAGRLYEAVGFRTEGVCRQARFKNGRYCDLVMMAILQDEWREHHG